MNFLSNPEKKNGKDETKMKMKRSTGWDGSEDEEEHLDSGRKKAEPVFLPDTHTTQKTKKKNMDKKKKKKNGDDAWEEKKIQRQDRGW
jgi:hypothetical protein